jgi:predicted Zn-dependent protease
MLGRPQNQPPRPGRRPGPTGLARVLASPMVLVEMFGAAVGWTADRLARGALAVASVPANLIGFVTGSSGRLVPGRVKRAAERLADARPTGHRAAGGLLAVGDRLSEGREIPRWRILNWVGLPNRVLIVWLLTAPRIVQLILLVFTAGAVAGGTWYMTVWRPEKIERLATENARKRYDQARRVGDEAGLRASLDDLIRAGKDHPDPFAVARRQALDTGEASPTDPDAALITMRLALRAGNMAAADREAAKRLAAFPNEWMPLLTRAKAAFDRGDMAAVSAFLDQLPRPEDPAAGLDPGGVLFSLQLFRAVNRDPSGLLQFIRSNIAPGLKSTAAAVLPRAIRVQLLDCYLEGFETVPGRRQPPTLGMAWAAAAQMYDRTADEAVEAKDVPVLVGLGQRVPRFAAALDLLKKDNLVTDSQYPPLKAEAAARGTKVWEAVRRLDPKNAEAYRGVALLKWQAGDYPAARETVAAGLAACGDNPTLAALFATMLQAEDRPDQAAAALRASAEKYPDQVVWWVLSAEAAAAARRADLAIEACRRGLAVDPKNPWLIGLEARLWVEGGDPHQAAQRAQALGPKALATNPGVARTYTRALTEAGLSGPAQAFLDEVDKQAGATDDPTTAAAALRGLTDARGPIDVALLDWTADRADRLLARWPDQPDLLRTKAAALARAAELAPPGWNPVRTQRAVSALKAVTVRFPDDREAVAALAWVRLKGDNDPAAALRDVAPLAQAEPTTPMTVGQLSTLGAVLAAAGNPADAVRVLERAKRAGMTPRGMTALARAYLAQRKPAEARAALAAAAGLKQTDADRADYLAAAKALDQEKP